VGRVNSGTDRCDVHAVLNKRSLRFLHELPEALQFQIGLGEVDFRRRFRNRCKKQSSVHGWGHLVAKGNFVILLARCSRLECELPHKSRNKQAASSIYDCGRPPTNSLELDCRMIDHSPDEVK
jgi:hypothetical protein